MHYFSIHHPQGEHLGFLVMLPDDENDSAPQSGRFAIKCQSEHPPKNSSATQVLTHYEQSDTLLSWQLDKDHIALSNNGQYIGRIRQEFCDIDGHSFVLTDLTGVI